jgi:lipopolysaccharide/colanic/teichoic acid biosynthesis glycosyltransferase
MSKKPSWFYFFIKRAFDLIGSTLAMILLSWLFAIIAIRILIEDGRPVIHPRICVGKGGKEYKMYKFRTMYKDANNLEKYLTPEQIEQYKREVKVDNDPRILKSGHFLRRASLDELPQLATIFLSNMSFIGPRPMVEEESYLYGEYRDEIMQVKPGLTGYWQVNGRSDCTFESGGRQKLELYYARNRSLWLDTKIFFKTFVVVLKKEGAR